MLSIIVMFAISAGILLAAQSGCIGVSLAGTDGSYDTPDTGLSEHVPVRATTEGGRMPDLTAACQIADTFVDMLFTGMLDIAYAMHAVLSLTAVDNITYDISLELNGPHDIATFESGGHTYAVVAAQIDDGVQILNVTYPSNITAAGNTKNTPNLELFGATSITTFESGGHTYAAVAAYGDDGVQILNVTDLSNITVADSITGDGINTDSLELNGARDITTFESGGHTYAAVAAQIDDGVQILNVTDPSNITAAGSITDDGTNTDDLELNGAYGITTFKSGGHIYAAVAAYDDDGVQILNVTDPSRITAAGSITDDGTNTDDLELNGARGITTFESGGHIYVAVAAFEDDGIQILNVTYPYNITAAGSITNAGVLELNGAYGITTFNASGHIYAAVAADIDDGVQILNVTDPSRITAAGSITDDGTNTDDLELNGARGITTFESGDHTYAAVAAFEDDGVQILRIDITEPDPPSPADAFVTTWTVSAGQNITINFVGNDMNISWGDSMIKTHVSGTQSHTYETAGNYTVSVTGGLTGLTLDRPLDFFGNYRGLVPELASIDQWGSISWTNMSNAFAGASNMTYSATDTPDLRLVTDTSYMFSSATAFDGNLSGWNVSSVTDMTDMFYAAAAFNQPLNDWDVSSVRSMNSMFYATSFNQTLNDWDVSSVSNMNSMFSDARAFNQPLNSWDVSSVTNMAGMFNRATSFNQTLNDWDVSSVTTMQNMFYTAAKFNQPLNDWDVSKVTNMVGMFNIATAFNQSLNDWNVSKVTDMEDMFNIATAFNQPLNTWDVSSVTDMKDMFAGATSFYQNLADWYVVQDLPPVLIVNAMFSIRAQNDYLDGLVSTYSIDDTRFVMDGKTLSLNSTNLPPAGMYPLDITAPAVLGEPNAGEEGHTRTLIVTVKENRPFITTWRTASPDQSITINFVGDGMDISWGDGATETDVERSQTHTYTDAGDYTVSVTGGLTGLTLDRPPDLFGNYHGPVPELASIDQWGSISWTNMSNAFAGASNMTYSATDTPDLSLVTDTSYMFLEATVFDGDLSSWDVSSVTDMSFMLSGATSFNQPLNAWNVSSVTDMYYMFSNAASFNHTISSWDVSSVTDMSYMFAGATAFNQPLNAWNVSSVTDMFYMFSKAVSFNHTISSWDVSSVTDMSNMFAGATVFNHDLNTWDVSSVTNISGMFNSATAFNQPLSTWDVSSVTDIFFMFAAATAFNQPLSTWDVSSVTAMNGMFHTATAFNQPLNAWDISSVTDMSYMFLGATAFDRPLNAWDVSSVTDMSDMFDYASSFDGDISAWDVSSVTYMNDMFLNATSFDQPLNAWDVSSVTDMDDMFLNATAFNQPLNDWDVSSVTDMDDMFLNATAFNQPLNDWDVSSVTNMDDMFLGATAFDQNLAGWYVVQDLPPVLTANAMFPIRAQNSYLDNLVSTYSVDDTRFVMDGKTLSLNSTNLPPAGMYPLDITAPAVLGEPDAGDEGHTRTLIVTVKGEHLPFITTWRTTSPDQVITINFVGSGMDISWGDGATETNVSGSQNHTYADADDYRVSVTGALTGLTLDRPDLFDRPVGLVPELASIDQWGGISWTNMSNAFAGASNMTYSATDTPDLSLVTDMSFMFADASAFNGDISAWDVSSVTDMTSMFQSSPSFNQPLNTWDVSSVTDMTYMFGGASSFNQPLNDWDVSSVSDMDCMFFAAASFDRPLNDWDVSSVTDMSCMFYNAISFDQPLNAWDVSSVSDMNGMFHAAISFDQPLHNWDVSSVSDMNGMFHDAISFDQPLHNWDVSGVTDMARMFSNADFFNQPLNAWDVSSVTDMDEMFYDATLFDQDLSSWYVAPDSAVLITDRSRTLTVMPLSPYIGEQSPVYTVSDAQFVMNGRMLSLNSANTPTAGIYDLAISATTVLDEPNAGTHAGTHTRTVTITVRDTPITPFITKWRTDSANQTITVPVGGSTARYSIDWGDNSPVRTGITGDSTHTYREAGIHTVSISGNFERIHLDGQQPNAGRLISIEQWGDMYWISMSGAFDGAYNMVYNAVAAPDLGLVSDMSRMFAGATIFDGDISGWDVSTVRDMSRMFYSAAAFDGEISDWDVSAVRNMNHMFARATSFDQPLNDWDVSAATDMGGMFTGASSFNHDLKAWDVSAATDMGGMFTGASSFNQDLSDWYVTLDSPAVIIPGYPRSPAVLPLSPYLDGRLHAYFVNDDNTQFVMDGRTILLADPDSPPTAGNYPLAITVAAVLGEPNTGSHTGNFEITVRAPVVEPFITVWRTSAPNQSVTIPGTGHGPVCNIDWGDGTAIENGVACHRTHTYAAAGNYRVSVSGGLERIGIDGRQPYADRLISIAQWGDTYWTSMRDAFRGASNMGYPATDTPNLSRVTGMSGMFAETGAFNGDISDWDVSSVRDMNRMFSRAASFNQHLDGWDVSKVTDMGGMFEGTPFNRPLSSWNVSSVITMRNMFYAASSFVQSLNDWDVSNVTDMYRMFSYSGIQHGLDKWDVSKVTNMHGMFHWAASFNFGDISGWDVSSVTDMNSMFRDATSFNHDISGWDVSSVTDMTDMFLSSIFVYSFEQNLGRWYVTVMPGDLRIASEDVPVVLGPISAQNTVLDGHSPVYGIGIGGDSDRFGITDGNILNMTSVATQSTYTVNVTASGPRVFENGDNWHILKVNVTGLNNLPDAEAGPNLSVDEGGSIKLQGSGSDDDAGDELTYSWSEHDLLTFDNRTSATPTVTASSVTANEEITLTLTVSDGTDSDTDTMVLTVTNLNHPPDAEAGPNLSVDEGGSIKLQGSGSDDDAGDELTYSWSEHDLLTFDNRTSATPTVTASSVTANEEITLTLTVSDGTDSDTDTMVLTVTNLNHPPDAEAGPNLSVDEGGSIKLQGSGSDDDAGDELTYSWSEHDLLTFDNRTSATPTVTASSVTANEEITLTLTVSDGTDSDTDTMVLTVTNLNHPPDAEAGPNLSVDEGGSIKLQGSGSDDDAGDELTYSWSEHDLLTFDNRTSATPTVTASSVTANEEITLTLTVSDGTDSDTDTMVLTVTNLNHPPDAEAGPNLSVDEGGSIKLQGSGSDDDAGDELTYSWSEHDLLTFDNRTSATPTVTASSVTANEEITLTLTVSDGTDSDTDTMVLTVTNLNHPPDAEAGPNLSVDEGGSIKLQGSGSDDDAGDELTYSWSEHDLLTFDNRTSAAPTVTASSVTANEEITLTLTVSDGTDSDTDTMVLTVTNLNHPPDAEAGPNLSVDEGGSIKLQGSGSDDDAGDELTYSWSEHDLLTFDNRTSAAPTVTASSVTANEEITLTLTVSDGTDSDTDTMVLTVTNLNGTRIVNAEPDAEAGPNLSVDEGGSIMLQGSGSDDDAGDELTYSWSEHDLLTFDNRTSAAPTVTASSVTANEEITLTLTVSDGTDSDTDTMVLTVTNLNHPPDAEAGPNLSVDEGGSIMLQGSGSDDDAGDELTYSWSEHDLLTFDNRTSAAPTVTASSVTANEEITLTLTVSDGTDSDTDTMVLTVTNLNGTRIVNAEPDAEAGPNLSVDEGGSIMLQGSGSDDDAGDELTYSWSEHDLLTFDNRTSATPTVTASSVTANEEITLTLTVSDGTDSDTDTMVLTVTNLNGTRIVNAEPDAEAGPNLSVDEGGSIMLQGSGSDDDAGDELTYSWSEHDLLTFDNRTSAAPTVTASSVTANEEITLTLTVSDGTDSDTDTMVLTVTNLNGTRIVNAEPDAEAGPDLSVDEGGSIMLQGSGSDDDAGDELTYSWSEHDLLTFDNRTSAAPTVTASSVTANEEITLTLTVSDGTDSDTDTMVLTVTNLNGTRIVNAEPDAEAGPNLSVDEGGSIMLQGSGSDDDAGDELTYSWSEHDLLTFDNRTSAAPTVTASSVTANEEITLTLTVSDGTDSDTDTMVLTVTNLNGTRIVNAEPDAEAGPNLSVDEGGSIMLQGSGSDDDAGDELTYSWSEHDLLTFDNRTSAAPTVTASSVTANEEITLTLTVSDGTDSDTDTMVLTVTNLNGTRIVNAEPDAEAGPNLSVDEGGSIMLQGSGSDDDAGDELTYSWSEHDLLTFDNRTSAAPTVTASSVTANEEITLTLTVSDGTDSDTDTMVLTVTNLNGTRIVNAEPDAEAGPDLSVDEGGSIMLQGSGSDDDAGDELTYSWSEHDLLTFDNRTSATPTVTASSVTANVNITLTLTVDDGTASETDTMVLTITNLNRPPVVDAGPDQTVKEGAQVSMPWTATDPDGDPLTYSWSQNPLLPAISLDSPDLSPTTFTAPAVDANTTFIFTLTVITGTHTVEDSLTVTVRNNHLPSVDAGPDKTVDEGTTVTLTGSASDPDRDPLTYAWTGVSGPSVTLTDGDTLRPQFAAPRVTSDEQIVFRLNATDDAGKSAEDTVTVTVRDVPIAVSSATYNPGNGQLTITFNQNIGSSDPDYSAMHIRSTGSDSGGIALSDIADRSHSGRTVTATLDSGQQEEYGDLESAQLDIAGGAVTDADGVPIIQMPDIPISDVSRKKSSSSKAPIVHINALVQARIVDIPPHIAEQVALHDVSDPLEPVMPDDTFDLPLVIDGRGYLLDDLINTLVLQTVTTGDGPTIITFTVYTQKDLAHFALYLNLSDKNTDYADSDTRITYRDDGTTVVTDPHGYIGDNSTITVTQEDDQVPEKKTVRITVEFEEPMGPTNMVAYMWNTDRKATFVRIIDAFEVAASAAVLQEPVMQKADPEPVLPDSELPADPEPVVPDSELPADPEPVSRDTPWPDDYDDAQVLTLIRMWSGFEPESITDAQLIDLLGLEDYRGADLPDWMMTELGVLVARGDVTVDEFMLALQYVLEHA